MCSLRVDHRKTDNYFLLACNSTSTTPNRVPFEITSMQWQKYTHGIVGGVFPDPTDPSLSLIISSPNMMTLPNPLVHTQRIIRVLQDGKWGVDDATLHPQVFRNATGHLPLILSPQTGAHASKRDASFGTIDDRMVATLEGELREVIKRFEDMLWAAEHANSDITSLSTRKPLLRAFKNALNCLSIPGTRDDCVWLWATVQRLHLDLLAFLDWHETFRQLYNDPPDQPLPVDTGRLGAITSSHESAEVLFKAGLPTYFIRRLGKTNLTTEIKHLLPDHVMKAVLSSTVIVAPGQQVGTPGAHVILKCSRADPSPIIFRGEAKNPHRLSAMTVWQRRDHPLQHPQNEWTAIQVAQLKEFGIYDATQHLLPAQSIPTPFVSSSTPSISHPRVSSTVSAASGAYTRASNRPSNQNPAQGASKKWANRSKLLSLPLQRWIEAAETIGRGHNDSVTPNWPGANASKTDWRGYAFPDAGMVANMSNDSIRNGALCSYVHHRPALVYRIQSLPDCGLKTSVWRSNLIACPEMRPNEQGWS
ncbi:hypothetical protein CYLTODRAFT_415558 [Cylindrobasidium torrendii FP15055 ss-10]|uniref:Uncharacterized protein n=1 Tax=Cylindrobasidium torrendii FP15055 ss-10 TaxID=1314674 RepID=A0A0D7ASS8_9AGAR|nr:hypothetical protein CYLTODRAFT_415558 [Cylindrobasidium torrendii FP15055 ss-10]